MRWGRYSAPFPIRIRSIFFQNCLNIFQIQNLKNCMIYQNIYIYWYCVFIFYNWQEWYFLLIFTFANVLSLYMWDIYNNDWLIDWLIDWLQLNWHSILITCYLFFQSLWIQYPRFNISGSLYYFHIVYQCKQYVGLQVIRKKIT